jgi:hypothetical protein
MKRILPLFTLLVIIATAFQGLIPTLPITDPTQIKVLSAVALFSVSALTLWKQFLSEDISNESLWPTMLVTLAATLGLVSDLTNTLPFTQHTAQWVRFGVTFVTMSINLASSTLYPQPDGVKKN